MIFKITNRQKCIDDLSYGGYKSLLLSLDWIGLQSDKHLEVPLMGDDRFVSITLISLSKNEVEYFYNSIIK